jgi:hypothetical protein
MAKAGSGGSLEKGSRTVKRVFASVAAAVCLSANAHSSVQSEALKETGCVGILNALPTKQISAMKPYYDGSRKPIGAEMAERLHSLADGGDKDAQFTYSVLLLTGRCVPQDICAARGYRWRSQGSTQNWEQRYPIPREFEKQESETICK